MCGGAPRAADRAGGCAGLAKPGDQSPDRLPVLQLPGTARVRSHYSPLHPLCQCHCLPRLRRGAPNHAPLLHSVGELDYQIMGNCMDTCILLRMDECRPWAPLAYQYRRAGWKGRDMENVKRKQISLSQQPVLALWRVFRHPLAMHHYQCQRSGAAFLLVDPHVHLMQCHSVSYV